MRRLAAAFALAAVLGAPSSAPAHSESAATEQLSMQPARALAQQAHALLHIRHDRREAAVRLDAALESKDRTDVDMPTLRRATELLDGGGAEQPVMDLIDRALSEPLGAASGKLLHGGGREFRPARDSQQVVAVAVGAALLALAAAGLWRVRRRPA